MTSKTVFAFLVSGILAIGSYTQAASPGVSPVTMKPTLVKNTTNTVTLEWGKVSSAAGYRVKYDTRSIENSSDPLANYSSVSSIITTTGTTLEKLTNTTYYFSIVSLDGSGVEAEFDSPELMVNLGLSGTSSLSGSTDSGSILSIQNVRVFDNKHIAIDISSSVTNGSSKVKIVRASDNSNVDVSTVKIDVFDPKRIVIDLTWVLAPSTAYKVVLVSAKTTSDQIITEAMNISKEFITTDAKNLIDVTVAWKLNAASNPSAVMSTGTSNSGNTLSGKMNSGSTSKTPVQWLPNTGASDVVLVFLFLLVAGTIYGVKRKTA